MTDNAPINWPKANDVGRLHDMGCKGHLRVLFDADNDVVVTVFDGDNTATVEFCVPGSGGGKSSRTRIALIELMAAMEADNADDPQRDWWQQRGQG